MPYLDEPTCVLHVAVWYSVASAIVIIVLECNVIGNVASVTVRNFVDRTTYNYTGPVQYS